uniref:Putative effector protein n=1 Tax=Heterodera avenae TaxID=34510 RepID=A0A2L0VDG6_HETAV|nr:putative effector protein [Heterodera avenae]
MMMMLSKIAITIFITCQLCFLGVLAAPTFPCCPGSQRVTTLMHGYIVGFTSAVDTDQKEAMCQKIIEDIQQIKRQLESMTKCEMGGGAKIVGEIDAQLFSSDACANGLSFVRAMFDLAAKATGHMKSSKWENVTRSFITQIGVVDQVALSFGININKNVHFAMPSKGDDAHQMVPSPSQMFSNPGKHSAYTK